MSQSGLAAFDSTIQTTNVWLNEIMESLGWQERQRAYQALRTVLHALRDRLAVNEAVKLGAQLPMLVRGFYYDGWHPSDKPRKERKREEFLAHMAQAFDCNSDANPETITRAVLQVVSRHVSAGEIQGVKSSLPEAIRLLWTEA